MFRQLCLMTIVASLFCFDGTTHLASASVRGKTYAGFFPNANNPTEYPLGGSLTFRNPLNVFELTYGSIGVGAIDQLFGLWGEIDLGVITFWSAQGTGFYSTVNVQGIELFSIVIIGRGTLDSEILGEEYPLVFYAFPAPAQTR